jgi:hypothetical protein
VESAGTGEPAWPAASRLAHAKVAATAQPDTDHEAEGRQIRERIRKLDQELDRIAPS